MNIHSLSEPLEMDLEDPFVECASYAPSENLQEERRRRASETRKKQVLEYKKWEEAQARNLQAPLSAAPAGKPGEKSKKVSFHVKDRLRDSVMRCDRREGR